VDELIPDLAPGKPAILRCAPDDVPGWLAEHRAALIALLDEHGALLVRGLGVASVDQATAVARAMAPTPHVEYEGFAPRDRHAPGVYSSSHWPSDQPMCMHHEVSYADVVPSLLVLSCLRAPARGGATGLADARSVLADLPQYVSDTFARSGWQLDRTYGASLGVSWANAFHTQNRAEVERYAREHRIEFRWDERGALRTRQRRPAVVRHPRTGEACWFNQVAFLSGWTLDPAVRDYLVTEYGADGLPFDTSVGDGTPIGPETVEVVNAVYERRTVREPWRAGDVLLIDNLLTAHSLEPYEGPREVVVAMAGPIEAEPSAGHGALAGATRRDGHDL
jgi:alpha-ketoglutarate-dependent taurine dioxygenase